MGRIKTKLVKRTTLELLKDPSNKFTKSYDENKRILRTKIDVSSKKIMNMIAGYITRKKCSETVL